MLLDAKRVRSLIRVAGQTVIRAQARPPAGSIEPISMRRVLEMRLSRVSWKVGTRWRLIDSAVGTLLLPQTLPRARRVQLPLFDLCRLAKDL